MVEATRQFGYQVFYGDARRLDLLRTAGAARARVLVVAVDGVPASLTIIDLARAHFPQLQTWPVRATSATGTRCATAASPVCSARERQVAGEASL